MQNMGDVMKLILQKIQSRKAEPAESVTMYKCNTCQDQEGWFEKREDTEAVPVKSYDVWMECECVRRRRAARLFESSRITDNFQNKTLTGFQTEGKAACIQEAHDAAVEYVQDFNLIRHSQQNSIALLGRSGSGKTHLLMAVANRLTDAGVSVLYFPWVEGFEDLKRNFDYLPQKIRLMQTVDVLFVDDLFKGRDRPTPWQLEQFFSIVNYRYLNQLPMMISSERSIDQLCDRDSGDEAIGTRIYERCRDYLVVMTGNINYRMNGGETHGSYVTG